MWELGHHPIHRSINPNTAFTPYLVCSASDKVQPNVHSTIHKAFSVNYGGCLETKKTKDKQSVESWHSETIM